MAAGIKRRESVGIPSSVSADKGAELLTRQIEKGQRILQRPIFNEIDHTAWQNTTREFLVKCFGSDSRNESEFLSLSQVHALTPGMDEAYWQRFYAKCLANQIAFLRSLLDVLAAESEISRSSAKPQQSADRSGLSIGKKVFVVHGRDAARREEVARFLEKLRLIPIVLHEQPNQGRTIIEKFGDYADVGFAVVLLTGDDRGDEAKQPFDRQKLRARQNVLFELGYFLGKLGRSRVCALYQEGVEIPSDYAGVLFVSLDERGAWKLALARELRAAEVPVDLNLAI